MDYLTIKKGNNKFELFILNPYGDVEISIQTGGETETMYLDAGQVEQVIAFLKAAVKQISDK
jgi:hypothetical protein